MRSLKGHFAPRNDYERPLNRGKQWSIQTFCRPPPTNLPYSQSSALLFLLWYCTLSVWPRRWIYCEYVWLSTQIKAVSIMIASRNSQHFLWTLWIACKHISTTFSSWPHSLCRAVDPGRCQGGHPRCESTDSSLCGLGGTTLGSGAGSPGGRSRSQRKSQEPLLASLHYVPEGIAGGSCPSLRVWSRHRGQPETATRTPGSANCLHGHLPSPAMPALPPLDQSQTRRQEPAATHPSSPRHC